MMSLSTYYKTVAIVFLVVALLHLARIVFKVEAVIDYYVVPYWISWVAVAIAGYLSVRGFQFSARYKRERREV